MLFHEINVNTGVKRVNKLLQPPSRWRERQRKASLQLNVSVPPEQLLLKGGYATRNGSSSGGNWNTSAAANTVDINAVVLSEVIGKSVTVIRS